MARRILGIKADWTALFFCALAACTFWFFKAMNRDYTDVIAYPLRIQYDQSRYIPLQKLPKRVRMNVTGYGWNLLKKSLGFRADAIVYSPEDIPARRFVTASELKSLIMHQMSGVTLNFIMEDTLYFQFDRVEVKDIKVHIDTSHIDLAPSFRITTPVIVSPEIIQIKGPATLLNKIPDSISLQIPQQDIREDYEYDVKVPDQGYDYRIKMLTREVRVRFKVEAVEKASIAAEPEKINFPADSSLVFDPKLILTYFVGEGDRGKVNPKDFRVILDYSKLDKKDSAIVPLLAKKPSFIKDYYFTPYAVRLWKK